MNRRCGVKFIYTVLLYIWYQFDVIDGAITTKAPQVLQKSIGKLSFKNNTGKIITLKVGADSITPEEQCQCTLFYQCDKDDTVDKIPYDQSCLENYVCCKLQTPLIENTFSPSTESTTEFLSSSTDSSNVPPSNGVTDQEDFCQCVPHERCRRTIEEQQSGRGGIDKRKATCDLSELCCPPQNIIDINAGFPTSTTPRSTDGPSQSDSTPGCGIRNGQILNRIVSAENLKNTSFGEFPWMALLLTTEISANGQRTDNIFVCGASIVSSKVVLTAAHCVQDVNQALLKVRVGEYDTHADATKEPIGHQDRQVIRIIQHPRFNSKVLHNDLALVEVAETFGVDFHIRPVCIPLLSSLYDYDPSNCLATGWGKNSFGTESQYPTTLKKVDLTIVPNDQCQDQLRKTRLGSYFILDPSFICAGGQSGMDTCEGDGGGPLVCAVRAYPNKYVQVGIVSWGIGCGNDVPAVYASLEGNLDWLNAEYNSLTVFSSSNSTIEGRKSRS